MKIKIKEKKDPTEYVLKFAYFPVVIRGYIVWWEYYDSTGWYCTHFDIERTRRYPSQLINPLK